MKKVLIQSITEKGRKALQQHLKEMRNLSFKQRMIFKAAGFKQEVISESPLTLCLTMKNYHSNLPHYIQLVLGEIKKALKQNGADEEDFLIEVKEER